MTASQKGGSENLHVYALQLTSIDDLSKNMTAIQSLLKSVATHSEPTLVCLPENALYMRVKEGDEVPAFKLNDSCFEELSRWTKAHKSWLHIGSVPLLVEKKLYNASVWITPDGRCFSNYKKIHLFDITLTGHKPIRESDVFAHGAEPHIFDLEGWKIGESICYDIRFSDLYHRYGLQGAHLILVPAAFLVKTGEAHWEVLLRARAIENQCYVLAAAQGGVHRSVRHQGLERNTFGNSLLIDPWGRVLNRGTEQQNVIYNCISKSAIAEVRTQIPMEQHRRLHKEK